MFFSFSIITATIAISGSFWELHGRSLSQTCSINLSARFNDYLKKDLARPSVFL
jgi:hypothetical protein